MAGKAYSLEVVTPEHVAFEGDVISLVAPGVEGYFGVLANHAPMMAALDAGVVKIEDALGSKTQIAISGGFFEVSQNRAIVLADTAEVATDIDVDRAEAALRRAREMLAHPTADIDMDRARRAVRRAQSRLKAVRS